VVRRQKSHPQQQGSYLPWAIAGGGVLAFIVLVAALARQPRTVRVGDHWHRNFLRYLPQDGNEIRLVFGP